MTGVLPAGPGEITYPVLGGETVYFQDLELSYAIQEDPLESLLPVAQCWSGPILQRTSSKGGDTF